jgi:lysophospholipase L1-like esterase
LRRLMLLILVVAAALAAWWALGRGADPAPAPAPAAVPAAPPVRALLPHQIPGTTLDEATTRQLLPFLVDSKWSRYDERAIVRPHFDRNETIDWPEHPAGRITLRTNNMGFREDQPTADEPAGLRVIVGGDSHTFGLVDNRDTLANVLERRLADGAGAPVEVLSAGVSGTGPDECLALLRVLLDLQPDVYVVVFYEGNDFANALAFSDFRSKRPMAALGAEEKALLDEVRVTHRSQLAQAMGQAFHFRNRPGDGELALQAALTVLRDMAAACAARDVEFVLAVLPAKEDADEDLRRAHLRHRLGLSAEEAACGLVLGQRLVATLLEEGLTVIDLQPAMRAAPRPLFWNTDHHLNVDGHALVAELLEPAVREALARRAAQAAPTR